MEELKNFTDLIAWKKAHQMALRIYTVSKAFPSDERFGLVSQMRRSAVSVSSNIAEGFTRFSAKDKRRFYNMAEASLVELQNQLHIVKDVGFVPMNQFNELYQLSEEVYRLINGLARSAVDKLVPSPHSRS